MVTPNAPLYKRPRVWTVLNLILLVVACAVLTAIGYQKATQERKLLEQDFMKSADAAIRSLATSISVPLYNYDKHAISQILQSYLAADDIYAVYVEDNVLNITIGFSKANSRISATVEQPGDMEAAQFELSTLKQPLYYEQDEIGSVVVYFSAVPIRRETGIRASNLMNWLIVAGIGFVALTNTLVWIYLFLSNKLDRESRRLSESEARFRAITDSAQDAIFCKDKDLRYTFANPAFARMVGIPLSEIIGKSARDFLAPEIAEKITQEDHRTLGGQVVNVVKERQIRGGDMVLHIVQVPMADKESRIHGISGIVRNVTGVKRLQDQLRQAQKMEAIGTLAGGIAHDFNNILAAMTGFTELALLDLPEESHSRSHLDEVLKAGRRAKDLVNRILAFSRRSDHQLKPVQLSLVAEDALKLLRASLPTTIDIRGRIEADDLVLGDPTQIQQIIMNLCTNAAHSMSEEGGVLQVDLRRVCLSGGAEMEHAESLPGTYLQLVVSDTGHGIPPELMDRIFEPFFTTKAVGEGTGLGLSVVHGIVKKYGGAIKVSSKRDEGTTFTVLLPVIQGKPEPALEDKTSPVRGKGHVLFVDDEEPLAALGKQMIESFGYEVTALTDSIEALALFRSNPYRFDAVVTDITMPNMTGMKLSREIKRIRREIPLIACTGFSHKVDFETASEHGIDRLLMKPVESASLASALSEVLEAREEDAFHQ